MAIRTKLAIGYSLLVSVILIFLVGIRYAGQQKMLQDQKDYSLKISASILESSMPRKIPSRSVVQKAVAKMVADYPDMEFKGEIIEVYDPSRRVVFSSSIAEEERFPLTDAMWDRALRNEISLVTLSPGDHTPSIRILAKPVFHREDLVYLIQVGSSMQDIESTLGNSVFQNLFFIPLAALLVGTGGWLLTRQALKPLDAVIATARRISAGDLSHRIETSKTGEEIRTLARSFNQMIAHLESSFQQIRDFSENVSHELRIPLAILKGQTELSLRRLRSEAEYRKVLESNLEEILRMERIVEKLLFLSKAERGEIELDRIEVDLNRLLQEIYHQFQVPAQEKELCLTLDLQEPVFIYGDEVLLRELIVNLVLNALTYTPRGGKVSLSLQRDKSGITFSVADTGCGVPESEIPRIFDRFYQVDKSRSSQGNGLGLSLCQWIVQAHQGKITVESIVGKGSRFTVFFPSSGTTTTDCRSDQANTKLAIP